MAKHIFMDAEQTRLEVLTPNPDTFYLMTDNLGKSGLTPETHLFAGILVPKDDANLFIFNLAKAMGVVVEFPPRADVIETPAVTIDYEEEDKSFTVSGDLREFLTQAEIVAAMARCEALRPQAWNASVNHAVAALAEHDLGRQIEAQFDSESSCFFGYVYSQVEADVLVDYLNGKKFL